VKTSAPAPILSKYSDIKNALQHLLQKKSDTAFVTISSDPYFVQFCYDPENQELIFEAIQSQVIDNEEEYFQHLGLHFDFDRGDGMYCKYLPLKDCSVDKIVQEIRTIFKKIYQTDLHYYEIKTDEDDDEHDDEYEEDEDDEEFEEEEEVTYTPPPTKKRKRVPWWLWIPFIALLYFEPVLGVICLIVLGLCNVYLKSR